MPLRLQRAILATIILLLLLLVVWFLPLYAHHIPYRLQEQIPDRL